MVETPAYDLIIFKVHYGKMTLKIYTKGERVLRVEVILHNAKAYRWGRSLPCFAEIVLRLQAILERFLNAVGCIDCCFLADETLEQLPQPARVGQTKAAESISIKPECAVSPKPFWRFARRRPGSPRRSWPARSAITAASPSHSSASQREDRQLIFHAFL